MSYSLTVRGRDIGEVTAQLHVELDKVVASQPIHARDKDAAIKCAKSLAGLVTVREGKELKVSVSGSVGWSGSMAEDVASTELNGAGLNVSVSLSDVQVQPDVTDKQ